MRISLVRHRENAQTRRKIVAGRRGKVVLPMRHRANIPRHRENQLITEKIIWQTQRGMCRLRENQWDTERMIPATEDNLQT